MTSTWKRLELEGRRKWRLVEEPMPQAPAGGVIIKTLFAGVCHGDVVFSYYGLNSALKFPVVLGHEIGGTIHSVSTDIAKAGSGLSVGNRVIVYPWGYSGQCNWCNVGSAAYPEEWLSGDKEYEAAHIYGLFKDGGYQNFIIVDDPKLLIHVPNEVPLDHACLIPCSGVTAYTACQSLHESISRAKNVKGSSRLGVVGCGGLGLWAIQIAKVVYPGVTVVAISRNADKLEDATAQGADYVYNWPETGEPSDIAQDLIKQTGGPLDGAVDFTGVDTVIERLFHSMDMYGTITLVGLCSDSMPSLPLAGLVLKNITVRGNMVGTQSQCLAMVELLRRGQVKPPPIEHVTLSDVEKVIDLLNDGKQRGSVVVKLT